ncbi:MAG: hypothetical protein ACTS73_00095 [Arsenophonus sp. NEOnobi-MAG3]
MVNGDAQPKFAENTSIHQGGFHENVYRNEPLAGREINMGEYSLPYRQRPGHPKILYSILEGGCGIHFIGIGI